MHEVKPPIRAVVVCVDFADLLAVSLPYNRHHFSDVLVVTTKEDTQTHQVARENRADCFFTPAFYQGGAAFAKFAALECALDHFGRHGWMALVDADTLWPRQLPESATGYAPAGSRKPPYQFRDWYKERIYSFRQRRLLLDVTAPVPDEMEWGSLPLDPQDPNVHAECMGFTQVFHCSARSLPRPPWHDVSLPTAALGDSYFQRHWDLSLKTWLDGAVLHLGDFARNWCGRVTPYRDGSLPDRARERDRENDQLKSNLWPAGK